MQNMYLIIEYQNFTGVFLYDTINIQKQTARKVKTDKGEVRYV